MWNRRWWKISWRTDRKIIAAAENAQKKSPKTDIVIRGIAENEVNASIEYNNSPQNDHFVLPAARGTLSNSSHFTSNPIHS